MDTAPFHIYTEEDRQLCLHLQVTACWRRDGYAYRAKGVVSRLAERSVTVKLTEAAGNGRFPSGTELQLPRFGNHAVWTADHCVRLHREGSSQGLR